MIITDTHVFFFTEWPSNFKKTDFEWEAFGQRLRFFCTEQAFMWAKAMHFGDTRTAEAILLVENDPMRCKHLGRLVENFDETEWDRVRYSYMKEVNIEKYRQDADLLTKLLDPEFDGKKFVEASPTDRIWGIGLGLGTPKCILDNENMWRGRNLLGQVVTEVREILKHDLVAVPEPAEA